jgi:hypothetical protein
MVGSHVRTFTAVPLNPAECPRVKKSPAGLHFGRLVAVGAAESVEKKYVERDSESVAAKKGFGLGAF